MRELFATAEHSVIVAGFRFDHGADILAPLHEAMAKRGVHTALFIDVPWGDGDGTARARAAGRDFVLVEPET